MGRIIKKKKNREKNERNNDKKRTTLPVLSYRVGQKFVGGFKNQLHFLNFLS